MRRGRRNRGRHDVLVLGGAKHAPDDRGGRRDDYPPRAELVVCVCVVRGSTVRLVVGGGGAGGARAGLSLGELSLHYALWLPVPFLRARYCTGGAGTACSGGVGLISDMRDGEGCWFHSGSHLAWL